MVKKSAITILVAAALFMLLFIACPGSKGELKIGAILPLSGEIENYGELIKNGMELAVAEINENGGVDGADLKIIYKDSQGKPEVATKVILDLINIDKVPVILGGVSSSVSLALAPIAEDKKVILLSPASSSPKLSGISDYFFRIYPSDTLEGYTMANRILNYQKKDGEEYFKNVVVVSSKTDYAEGVKIEFVKEFRRRGGVTDAVINYDPDEPKFDDVMKELKRAVRRRSTGAVYVTGYYTDIANFLLALKKLPGWDPQAFKVFASASVYTPKFRAKAAEFFVSKKPDMWGLVFPVICHITPDSPDEEIAKFAKNYYTQYKSYPESLAAHGFDSVKLIADVIERRGLMPQDLQFGLSITKDWQGIAGKVTFDERHDVSKYPILYGFDGKTMLILDPAYRQQRKEYFDVVDWK